MREIRISAGTRDGRKLGKAGFRGAVKGREIPGGLREDRRRIGKLKVGRGGKTSKYIH